MKEYQAIDIRNFSLVGHGSSGKTMLSEAMLACSGVISRLGSIDAGSTVSDYHVQEHERQISIFTSLLHAEWEGKKFNIIDTPGYLDFLGESLGALRVSDFALVLINAASGVEVGTDQVWGYADQYNLPRFLVVNHLDKENIDFTQVLEKLKERFGKKVLPLTFPVNPGAGFNKVVDLLTKKAMAYKGDGSKDFSEETVPEELKGKIDQIYQEVVECVAESDDALLEKFFEEGDLSEKEMLAGLALAIEKQSIIPLFSVSAENNVGVSQLMNFIAKYAPSPLSQSKVKGLDDKGSEVEISLSDQEPVIYIFKTLNEAHIGEMSFFRLYSGSVSTGLDLYNSTKKASERVGQIYVSNGSNRESVKSLVAGEIGTMVKLRNTHTGNTLCSSKKIIELPQVEYPKPNIHGALKLKSKGEEDKMAAGLSTLHDEDPTFIYKVDPELHQTVISGQGELHLQVISARLKNRFNVEIDLVEPKIPYRETITAKGEGKYRHKKQSGGAGQFAEVWMRIEPKPRNTGVEFTESLVGQNVDRVFVPSVEKGVNKACEEGIIAGYRVVDVKIDFYDGKQHPVDSKDVAFQTAGKYAFREAFAACKPCLLEPICKIEVKVPEECMGDVMGDISSRRGKILGMDSVGNLQIIKAEVPQAELYHYSITLRSMTGGRGIHSEEFSHYNQMPKELEAKVIEEHKKVKEED